MEISIRKTEYDILKGILIICVVIGHTCITIPFIDLFWFHMPAFFLITGILTKNWFNIKDFWQSIKSFKKGGYKKLAKFIFPYFSYSLILYFIFQPTSFLSGIYLMFYGGTLNTNLYSYPFWYMNCLFFSILIYSSAKSFFKKGLFIIVLIFWIIAHLHIFRNIITTPLPWGIDNAIGVIIYLYLGDLFKQVSFKRWHLILLLIPIIFIFANKCFNLSYYINCKDMTYNHALLDIIVPVSFTYLLYQISILIKNLNLPGRRILSYLGVCSISIYFTHAAILQILDRTLHLNIWVCVLSCLIFGSLLQTIFKRNKITSLLFLGKEK